MPGPTRDVMIRSVDPRTVLRMALVFFLCLWLVVLVAWTILWTVAAVAGVTRDVERFIAELFTLRSFRFTLWSQARAAVLGGAVWVALGTGMAVLGAVFYNLISETTGGIRASIVDDEETRAAR